MILKFEKIFGGNNIPSSFPEITEIKYSKFDYDVIKTITNSIEALWKVKIIKIDNIRIVGWDEKLQRIITFMFTSNFELDYVTRWSWRFEDGYDTFKGYYAIDDIIQRENPSIKIEEDYYNYNWHLYKLVVLTFKITEPEYLKYRQKIYNDIDVWKIIVPDNNSFLIDKIDYNEHRYFRPEFSSFYGTVHKEDSDRGVLYEEELFDEFSFEEKTKCNYYFFLEYLRMALRYRLVFSANFEYEKYPQKVRSHKHHDSSLNNLIDIECEQNGLDYVIEFKLFFKMNVINIISYLNVNKYLQTLEYSTLPKSLKEYCTRTELFSFEITDNNHRDFLEPITSYPFIQKFNELRQRIIELDNIERERIQTSLEKMGYRF